VDEAREHARTGSRPDVILADYRLAGGQTGLQAIAAAREIAGAVPAVIVTGDTAPQRIAEANAAGFPVLHKPLDGSALLDALCEAADGGTRTLRQP
jgi:two-component system, sensor histidine kinase